MKYVQATANTIRREVSRASKELKDTISQISLRKKELSSLDAECEANRELARSLEDASAPVLRKIEKDASALKQKKDKLDSTIKKLEYHRAVLSAEIEQPPLASTTHTLVDSSIKFLQDELDRIVSQTAEKEGEKSKLEEAEKQFKESVQKLQLEEGELLSEITEQERQLKDIEEKKSRVLQQMVREQASLNELSKRKNDIAAMELRLTDEYQEVYKGTPSRTNKV